MTTVSGEQSARVMHKLVQTAIKRSVVERLGGIIREIKDGTGKDLTAEEKQVAATIILDEIETATKEWIAEARKRLNKQE